MNPVDEMVDWRSSDELVGPVAFALVTSKRLLVTPSVARCRSPPQLSGLLVLDVVFTSSSSSCLPPFAFAWGRRSLFGPLHRSRSLAVILVRLQVALVLLLGDVRDVGVLVGPVGRQLFKPQA